MKSFKFPLVESEEEYDELCRAANILHRKHGKSIDFYMDCVREDPFEGLTTVAQQSKISKES